MDFISRTPEAFHTLVEKRTGVLPTQNHLSDGYQDWIDNIVLHINECDPTLISLEGHYRHYEYDLRSCCTEEEGYQLKDKLNAYLASRPERRARQAHVSAALQLILEGA